jgi:hypothetical protein
MTPQEPIIAIREASFGWEDEIFSDVTLEVHLFGEFDIL